MAALFAENGIQFRYPENWILEREDSVNGWTVSVQSPATAFMVIAYDSEMPDMELVANTALDVLRADYKDLESDERFEALAGQPAVGHDVRFFSFDLTNTCAIRSFYSGHGTVLVMWQANDLELEENEPVLRAICASMKIEED